MAVHACTESENIECLAIGGAPDRRPRSEANGEVDRVVAFYQEKTDKILRKYGRGTRVHFHVGIFPEGTREPDPAESEESLRARLCASQDALCEHLVRRWDVRRTFAGRVLDVGCGLGGGAIFWAQRAPAWVTAITITPGHPQIVEKLARRGGMGGRVQALLADACRFQDERPYDAAVALESSCYLDRDAWFARLAGLIRPGGSVCIEDSFFVDPVWRAPFDAYWHTRIGSESEYVRAAGAHGFELVDRENATMRMAPFWRVSIAWNRAILANTQDPDERARLVRSIDWHEHIHEAWCRGAVDCLLLRFRRAR